MNPIQKKEKNDYRRFKLLKSLPGLKPGTMFVPGRNSEPNMFRDEWADENGIINMGAYEIWIGILETNPDYFEEINL